MQEVCFHGEVGNFGLPELELIFIGRLATMFHFALSLLQSTFSRRA